jgi:hypothetical protein
MRKIGSAISESRHSAGKQSASARSADLGDWEIKTRKRDAWPQRNNVSVSQSLNALNERMSAFGVAQ